MKSTLRLTGALAAIAALGLSLAACSGGDAGGGDGPIKIGAIITKTGTPYSFDAVGIEPMTRAVFDQVNADGGIGGREIEYITVDDANTPAGASQAARQLIDQDGVVMLVGGGTYVACTANAEFYAEADIYAIEAVGQEDCGAADNITRTNPGPLVVNAAEMVFANQELGLDNVCALQLAGPSVAENQLALDWYEQATGDEVVFSDLTIPADTSDMTPYLLQAKDAGCEAILMGGNIQDLPAIAGQMATQGMQDVALLPLGYDPAIAETLDSLGISAYVAMEFAPFDDTSEDMLEYLAFAEEHGLAVNSFTQGAYLAATYAVEVLQDIDGEITRESVSRALESMDPVENTIAGSPFIVGTPESRVPNTSVKIITNENGGWKVVSDGFFTLPALER